MKTMDEFKQRNLKEWKKSISRIFPVSIPTKCEWTEIEDIINVLNCIGKASLNHMLLPTGGGMDLVGADIAVEDNCIKLYTGKGTFEIVKPKKLVFNSIDEDYEWDYFRLETDKLNPSGVYDCEISEWEELTYLSDGRYLDRYYWDMGHYDDEYGNRVEFKDGDTVITRYLDKSSFIIVAKTSVYNSIPETYDGRHNKMSDEQFYNHMKLIKRHFEK